jgi:putative acetyltransferase
MPIRQERPGDADSIRALTAAAFKGVAHSDQTEAQIVDALRAAGALTLSLVAMRDGEIVGHVAFSPVRINGATGHWQGLGPVSVWPERQRKGIGQALIREGLAQLKALASAGCVVLGDPGYYGRFGFIYDPGLVYGQAPPGYFQRLTLSGADPKGEVTYHPGFDASAPAG